MEAIAEGLGEADAVLILHGLDEPRPAGTILAQAGISQVCCFDDVETPSEGVPISEADARAIVHLVDQAWKSDGIERLYIACEAGVSRSVAVGLWAAATYDGVASLPEQAVGGAFANRQVAGMLAHVGNGE